MDYIIVQYTYHLHQGCERPHLMCRRSSASHWLFSTAFGWQTSPSHPHFQPRGDTDMLHVKASGTDQSCNNVDYRHTNSLHVALNCSQVLCCTMLETASAIRGMAASNTELVCKDNSTRWLTHYVRNAQQHCHFWPLHVFHSCRWACWAQSAEPGGTSSSGSPPECWSCSVAHGSPP